MNGLAVPHRFQPCSVNFRAMYPNQAPSPIAHMTTLLAMLQDVTWFPDLGVTHHITIEDSYLMHKTPNTSGDKVFVGDGKGLTIQHIGTSLATSPFSSSTLLTL